MKTLPVLLALVFALPAHAEPKPRVTGWNPSPRSGWKFDQGGIPQYPDAAVRQRLEGDVLLNVRISPAGRIDVVESAHGEPALVAAVRQKVSTWSFRPAAKDTRPATAHVPVGISFRLDLDLPDLLERAQGLSIERRGPDNSVVARLQAVTPEERTNVARALTQKGFLKADKGASSPKDANWRMSWRTQGRVIDVLYSETTHAVLVIDEARRWSGSNAKAANALQDVVNRILPPQ